MPTTKNRATVVLIEPPAPDYMRAYIARGLDLDWTVKRYADGKVIAKSAEKAEAKQEAELLGFSIY